MMSPNLHGPLEQSFISTRTHDCTDILSVSWSGILSNIASAYHQFGLSNRQSFEWFNGSHFLWNKYFNFSSACKILKIIFSHTFSPKFFLPLSCVPCSRPVCTLLCIRISCAFWFVSSFPGFSMSLYLIILNGIKYLLFHISNISSFSSFYQVFMWLLLCPLDPEFLECWGQSLLFLRC